MSVARAFLPIAAWSLVLSLLHGSATAQQPQPDAEPAPASQPAELPPPPPPPVARRYGDRGTSEIAVGAGYSTINGFVGAAGFRHFVADGLAAGVHGTYLSGGTTGTRFGLLLADLRLVPVRARTVALVLTPRAGRVLISDHPDGWAIGASAGVIMFVAPNAGFELGYEVLRLTPASFCADLSTCVLHGPVLGFRFGF